MPVGQTKRWSTGPRKRSFSSTCHDLQLGSGQCMNSVCEIWAHASLVCRVVYRSCSLLVPMSITSTAFVSKLFGECTSLRGAPQCFPRSPPKTQHPFRHTFASQVAREPLPNHSCIGCHLYSVRKCVYSGAAKVWKTRNHVVAASRYSSRPDIKSRL